jgi:hypothetical protein
MHIIIKYILIGFVFAFAWTIIQHVLGYNTTRHDIGQYTRQIPAFVFWIMIIAAIIERKKSLGGVIDFKTAINTGGMVALGYSVLVTIWYAIYAELINTQFQPTLMAFERSKLEAKGASEAVILTQLEHIKLTSGGSVLSYLLLFVFMSLFGLGIALITSLIVQRKRRKKTP